MEIKELFKFNEWWETGKVSEKNLEKYKRYLFKKILKFAEDKQIILLTGLRRVGKTKLLYQTIHALLEKGVEKRKILYFSFDEEAFSIQDVLETYRKEILRKEFKEVDKIYIFFDEIQKVKGWESKIKVYYDLNPNIKFFLTGSAALILAKRARESFAGRMYEFVLKPLTFKEFLEMKSVKVNFEDAKLLNEKILPYFSDFLTKAGFPEIIFEEDEEKIRSYIKLAVIERIIYRDIPSEFGRTDIELLEKLVDIFLKNPGSIINFDSLAKDLRRDKKTLIKYVYYLRFSMLINLISNFRISILATSRKNRKVYPTTSALVFAEYGRFDERIVGVVLETACIEAELKHYFRAGQREIDFLMRKDDKLIPIEIKTKLLESKLSTYVALLAKLGLNKGLLLTTGEFGEFLKEDIKILVYPIWVFLVFTEEILKKLG